GCEEQANYEAMIETYDETIFFKRLRKGNSFQPSNYGYIVIRRGTLELELAAQASETKQNWMHQVNCPNVTVDIIVSDHVDKGLLDYTRDNEIHLLGLLHRNLPAVKRLFSVNHSKLFLKHSRTALLIYNESLLSGKAGS